MVRARKAMLVMLMSFLVVILTTGCWNRKELDQLGIQLGTAIDKVGDNYQVAVQVVIPGEVSVRTASSGRSPVTLYKATAPTVFEAFRKLTETSSRKIYSAHIRVLVIGESLAREGISDILDMFFRNPEARTDFYLMVARGSSAEQVLKILTSLEKIPADNLFYALDTSAKIWAPTTTVALDELIDELVSEGRNPVLTGVRLIGNPKLGERTTNVEAIDPEARTRITGLAVFRKDKLIGWLNERESKGYNYIMDNVSSSAGHQVCPKEGYVVLETIRNHTKVKSSVVDGEPHIKITSKTVASIADVECSIDLMNNDTINLLEQGAEENMTKLMKNVIETAQQKFALDIFGFGDIFYKQNPKAWKLLKEDWSEHFVKLKVDFEPDVIIHKIGTTNNSFQDDIKE